MKALAILILVLAIDMFLFMGQTAVLETNPSGNVFYGYEGTLAKQQDAGNYTLNESVINKLPSGEASVSAETGNIFTDLFTSIKSFFVETTGLGYLLAIVNAVPNFLKAINLPGTFVFLVGAFWHSMTLFMLISFFWGREQ